jgi:putative ABC transport system permease protein
MRILQPTLEAIESLTSNKLRTALTILGVVIGVAAVVAMLAIGNGATDSITGELDVLGTNVLYVFSGGEAANPEPLTMSDAAAIADPTLAPSVANVAPVLQGQVVVSTATGSIATSLVGITTDYYEVQEVNIAEGDFITDIHVTGKDSVVILGTDVAEEVFDTTTGIIGETIRINGDPFTVVGVLETRGGTTAGSSDNQILVPLTTTRSRLVSRESSEQVDLIFVQSTDAETLDSAMNEVSQILRSRHRSTLGVDDFEILNTASVQDAVESIFSILTIFLGGIAGISLLVGGIGIMNIMLVSVIERTKEIGLRKAMGARKKDIMIQFLVESSILSLGGGIIGILFGWLIAVLVDVIAANSGTPLNSVVTVDAILLATLFSAAVGIFFGLYPSNRAASLEPVEALRTD